MHRRVLREALEDGRVDDVARVEHQVAARQVRPEVGRQLATEARDVRVGQYEGGRRLHPSSIGNGEDAGGFRGPPAGQSGTVTQLAYYATVIVLSAANVVLAAVAYTQRAKQLRGNRLREQQLRLAERRNALAEQRVQRLDEQIELLTVIRDAMTRPESRRDPRSKTGPVGVIDVGSMSVRMVVARHDPGSGALEVLADERAILGLAAEIERSGRYTRSTVRQAAARVAAFEHLARRAGCRRLATVLTAPARMGANPGALVDAIAAATGSPPTILTPTDEARLAFVGATAGCTPAHRPTFVCDVGGGSTELAMGTGAGGVTHLWSFEAGALRLAERHFAEDIPSREELAAAGRDVEAELEAFTHARADLFLATGGSARAVAKLVGSVAGRGDLDRALDLCMEPTKQLAKRVPAHRRRTLPAGVLILSALQRRLDVPVTFAPRGLREGALHELARDAPLVTTERGGQEHPVAAARPA
jgi:exopolyphosphatase/guanosine-5'-triphosphate,3'-diphosphate pyrophosphatase